MTQLQKESLDQTSVPYTKYLFIILALTGAVWLLAGPLQNFVTATVGIGVVQGFTCGTSQVQDADGNSYDTVQIGTQCWMASNLNVGTRVNISTTQTDNATIEKWCYDDTDANCDTNNNPNYPDGGLYQWDEAMQYSTTPGAQGICPTGWHIPTHDEFTTLERAVCTSGTCATDFPYDTTTTGYRGTTEGTKLKPNGESGFEGNLAGYGISGSFFNRGAFGFFWSSLESGGNAWYRYLYSGSAQVNRSAGGQGSGLSVRCVKDDPTDSNPTVTIATTPVIDELEQGLVGHWTFDGPDVDWGSSTAEIKDKSGNGNHGDAQGGMSTRSVTPGKLGQGMRFDGIEDYVDVGTSMEVDGEVTVTAWVKVETFAGGTKAVVGHEAAGACNQDYGLEVDRVNQKFSANWGCLTVATSNALLNEGTWYHLTSIRRGSAGDWDAELYLNGKLDKSVSTSVDPNSTNSLLAFGKNGARTGGTAFYFPGEIDDVRIYNRALSADEVMRLYKLGEGVKIATTVKSPGSPLEQGLVGHWTFDGPDVDWGSSTAEIKDKSGNGNHGDAQGGMSTRSVTPGKLGQGMSFDGNAAEDQYVTIGTASTFSELTQTSISAWVYHEGTITNGVIFSSLSCDGGGNGPWTNGFMLDMNMWGGTRKPRFIADASIAAVHTIPSDAAALIPQNEWAHVVATWDGTVSGGDSGVTFYIDGVAYTAVTSGSTPSGSYEANVTAPRISRSCSYNSRTWDGKLDDVRVYNRVLSAGEVQHLYQLGR